MTSLLQPHCIVLRDRTLPNVPGNPTYAQFVGRLCKTMPTRAAHLDHMALGLAGELGELLEALNATGDPVEELGDFMFFLIGALEEVRYLLDNCIAVNGSPAFWNGRIEDNLLFLPDVTPHIRLVVAVGEVVDVVKKHSIYEQPLLELRFLKALLLTVHVLEDFTSTELLEDAAQHNVAKLQVRYMDGYSDAAAKERRDKRLDMLATGDMVTMPKP
jgi:hypothetical protein